MKLQLPNSAFIGNIESFLKKLDPADPDVLSVTFNPKWVSVHPVVLSMVACLADSAIARGIQPEVKVESIRSLPYLVRMGLVLAGALLFRADWPQIVAYILGLTIARTILVRSLGSARARDGGAEECT